MVQTAFLLEKMRFSSRKWFWSWAKLPNWLLVERFAEQSFTLALLHTLARLGPGPFKGSIPKHRCINPRCFHTGWALGPSRAIPK